MTSAARITDPSRKAIDRTIGKRVQAAMRGQQLTVQDMAEMLDMTELRLSRILKGSSTLSAAELYWAAKVLDVPVSQLLPTA